MPLEIASLKRDKKDGRLKIVFLWIFFWTCKDDLECVRSILRAVVFVHSLIQVFHGLNHSPLHLSAGGLSVIIVVLHSSISTD